MGQYTSYWMYQKYETRGEQDPIPVYPNYWSVDADGTLPKITKLENDEECGYRPDAQYRWVNMDITKDYYCDECSVMTRWIKSNETICVEDEPGPTPDPQYRILTTATTCVGYDLHVLNEYQKSTDGGETWSTITTRTGSLIEEDSESCGVLYRWFNLDPSTDYYCSGSTKMYKQQKQKSYDNINWENVVPAEYRMGGTAETQSIDCGYSQFKLIAKYSGGGESKIECNNNTTLTSGETKSYSAMTHAVIGNCVYSIGESAFRQFIGLTGVVISTNVTYIARNAFYMTSINHIDIPDSVRTIGNNAFGWCTSLTSVTLSNTLTSIGQYAFTYTKLSGDLIIPNSVTSISGESFTGGLSITSLTIGTSIRTIGSHAFDGCRSLTSITILATTPPTLADSYVFANTNDCPIYVPAESVEAYKSAEWWSYYYYSRIQPIS